MTQKTLLELVQPQELDYVEHFRTLAALNLEMARTGPTVERLLRKSILEMDVGNFAAGLDAARDAAGLRPDEPEARFQEGMALVLLAFQKAGALAATTGSDAPVGPSRGLLEQATKAFGAAVRLNPDDDEATSDLEVLAAFLLAHPSEDEVQAALLDMWHP